jgi:multiple sugar transport system permease protein
MIVPRPRRRVAPGVIGRGRIWLADGPGFPFLMLLPSLIVLGLVIGLPILRAIEMSFDTLNLRRPANNGQTGLHNYLRLLIDQRAWNALGLSAIYMTGSVVGSVGLALAAALLTRRVAYGQTIVRLTFLIPWTVPAVVTALVWGVMYDGNFGVVNRTLDLAGLGPGEDWLIDRRTVLWALLAAQVWNEFPMSFVFLLAGLMAIPNELYEAARIDRAGPWSQFRFVTLPQLRQVLAITVVLSMIMGFKAFPIIFVLTGGGPNRATETLTILTFTTAFRDLDFAYAATLGVLALAVSALMVSGYLRLVARLDDGREGV